MLYRFAGAVRRAAKEESFAAIASAGAALVLTGTVIFTLGEGWNIVDGFYFAVATLTTSSIADPDLVLTHDVLKIFTALYVLTGIGILVELACRVREDARGVHGDHPRQARRRPRPAP